MSPTHSLDLRLIFYCLFSTVYCLLLTICELPSISPWYHSNTEIRDAVEQYTEDFNKNLLPTHSPDLRLIFFFLWLLSTNYCLLPSAYHTLPYHSNMEIRDAVEQYTEDFNKNLFDIVTAKTSNRNYQQLLLKLLEGRRDETYEPMRW